MREGQSTFTDSATSSSACSFQSTLAANDAMAMAKQLLSINPDILAIVTKAQFNPKMREAVNECMGNPSLFGLYLNDPDVGPILDELKQCLARQWGRVKIINYLQVWFRHMSHCGNLHHVIISIVNSEQSPAIPSKWGGLPRWQRDRSHSHSFKSLNKYMVG